MATFYVLPARLTVGQRFGEFLENLFPGLTWERSLWFDLAESLGAAAAGYPAVYVIFREDLAEGPLFSVLRRDFGAEDGDEIIEVSADIDRKASYRLAG